MAFSGMILIREVADAPDIMGISKPAGLKSPCGEVKIVNPLFVGIDVSSKSNVAYLMNPDGSKYSSFSVQNNLGGAKLLSERIVSALSSMRLSDVVIGLEATSIYGDSLVYALREDGRLGRFQRKIHVLNPKQVRKFKEAYPDLPKNDFVDAFVIADHLRFGRIAKETNYGKSIAKSKKVQEEKMGIAKQSCLCSPHGAGMNQAKSNATFLVSNVKMTRISL